jgi:hypothetical protein
VRFGVTPGASRIGAFRKHSPIEKAPALDVRLFDTDLVECSTAMAASLLDNPQR